MNPMNPASHIAKVTALLCLWAVAGTALAQGNERLPAYQRVDKLQGAVQLSGSSAVALFARTWGTAFQQIYP